MDDRLELARQIFAQITMVFEDAITVAVEGQAPTADPPRLIDLALSVRHEAQRVEALAHAVLALFLTYPE